jgi:two-component system cell cycle sensor histidine kinase/response regulator CckA
METPLSLLIIDDSEDDALLLMRELRRSGYAPTFERVDTAEAMRAALARRTWDVVIADYAMPHFSALPALELLQASGLDLPFIVVSGTIGEEVAVKLMRSGAHDYVMKDNLARLGPAIRRELDEARIRQDRRELEESLERAQRMEALGKLAGGVAHDLNNMLGPLVAYPELLLEDLSADHPFREDLISLQQAAERAAALVQDLLTLARRGKYQAAPLSLNTVVEQYLDSLPFLDLQSRYPNVTVEVSLAPDLLRVVGSHPHLSKVIMNLVTNAFEAMPKGGQLRISTYNSALARPVFGYSYIEAGDYAVLEISDTGTGIAQEDVGRIFEPFYTKKEMGRSGSGLGLAVVYGVVQDHMGRIDLQTEVGVGTRFALYFPITSEILVSSEEEQGDYRGDETVLVIDDLEQQRQIASRLLTFLGYQVTAVESGRAALDYLRDHDTDILVLDMLLEEGFDGLDTYREILRMKPQQKAVLVSGYSETDRVVEAQRMGAGRFVRKPYTLAGLGRAVRAELDAGSQRPVREGRTWRPQRRISAV